MSTFRVVTSGSRESFSPRCEWGLRHLQGELKTVIDQQLGVDGLLTPLLNHVFAAQNEEMDRGNIPDLKD